MSWRWMPSEDALLITGVADAKSNKALARELDRSVDAVQARIRLLREKGLIPPPLVHRRSSNAPLPPPAIWQRADMAHALAVIDRLLPEGMRLTIYRPEGERGAVVEAAINDEVRRHRIDDVVN